MDKKHTIIVTITTAIVIFFIAMFGGRLFTNNVPMVYLYALALVLYFAELFYLFMHKRLIDNPSDKRFIPIFMGFKTAKLLFTLSIAFYYLLMVKINIREFLFCFIIIYIIYLAISTMYLTKINKKNA